MAPLAWITGASSGIGQALAYHLVAQGWRVACTARRAEVLQGMAAANPLLLPYPADVSDAEANHRTVKRLVAEHGWPQLVVLNAGTHESVRDMAAFSAEPFVKLMHVNYLSAVYGLEAILPEFLRYRQQQPDAPLQIAVVSSVAGWRGLPTASAYAASKAALIAMCESLKFDLDTHAIALSVVCPGFVKTPLTDLNPFPMPHIISPQRAAEYIMQGLQRRQFCISFPPRFAWQLKLLRVLPYAWFFPLVKRVTKRIMP